MSGLSLAHMPFDMYTVIFSFLHPMDIMAVGQTCKTLHSTVSTRSIWVEALHRTMSTNSIFGHTFHRASDSSDPMTLEELQHASTAPARMLRLIEAKQEKKCYKNRKLRPLYTTVIPVYRPDEAQLAINKIFLVPGGRYVVATSDKRLMLIDLERFFNSSRKEVGKYMVFCDCPDGRTPLLVGPSPDGTRLRIFLSEMSNNTGFEHFTIYQYNPSSHKLSVFRSVLLQTVRKAFDAIVPSLVGNLLVFLVENVLYVWDFGRDMYASWQVDADIDDPQDIIVVGDKIILIGSDSLSVWEIPPLLAVTPSMEPSNQTQASSVITRHATLIRVPRVVHSASSVLPMVTGASLFPSEPYSTAFNWCIDDWFSGAEHPLVFDTFQYSRNKQRKDVAFRQKIRLSGKELEQERHDKSTAHQIPQSHVDLSGCYAMMDSDLMFIQRSRCAEGRIVIPWFYCGLIYLLSTPEPGLHTSSPSLQQQASSTISITADQTPLSSFDNPNNYPTLSVDIAHGTTGNIANEEFSFDPPSGRLCQTTGNRASLFIHDFLLVPHSVAEKQYSGNVVNFYWKEMQLRRRQLRNESVEKDLFPDETDDELFYDDRSSDDGV